jgi:Rrf2 family transcriptional regulator, nitric oxide-sensitive transcriptional repressor
MRGPRLLNFSDAAHLALHAILFIGLQGGKGPISVGAVARDLGVSEAHLSKVLQRLGRLGFVRSRRGPKGGFVLGKSPEDISLADILAAIDGPLDYGDCLLGHETCLVGSCILGDMLGRVYVLVRDHLDNTRVSTLIERQREIEQQREEADEA